MAIIKTPRWGVFYFFCHIFFCNKKLGERAYQRYAKVSNYDIKGT